LEVNFDRFNFAIHKEKEMADFRKISVLVALVLLLTGAASAQITAGAFTCTANAAVPPTLRSEGMTELVGDIVLDCTGGVPTAGPIAGPPAVAAQNIPQVNFTVFLNTNITSRILDSFNTSEALLIVDEPTTNTNASPLTLCGGIPAVGVGVGIQPATGCLIAGTGITNPGGVITAGPEPYCGSVVGTVVPGGTCQAAPTGTTRANAFRGIVTGNQVQFIGVPVDAPGTSGHRIFRFTNIRANASGISAGASGTPGSIQALISASGSTSVPINNPTQIVGFVQAGLTFATRVRGDYTTQTNLNTHIGFPQCNNAGRTASTDSFILEFKENFPTAFKTRGNTSQSIPGNIYNTESGFTNGTALGTTIGYADSGTRLKATFNNIPAGVNVWASLNNYGLAARIASDMTAVLISGEAGPIVSQIAAFNDFVTPSGFSATVANGGFASAGTSSAAQLAVVNGAATAVWEVTAANALSADSYFMAVWFSFTANAAQNSPAPGTATVTGSFAPTPAGLGVSNSAAAQTSQTLPIPRFAEGSASRAIFVVYLCRTNLLFPFVTNQAGFDTGLAIANTSLDTGLFFQNTPTQTGACNVYSFGDNAPASFATGSIAPGKVWVDLASTRMPNFQGYIIAQCAFQFAHGFAFVSDFGARNLAMGYLALVLPEPGNAGRAASSLDKSGAGSGEQLGN